MKKSILNLGKVLNKAEQKNVNGGDIPVPLGLGPCGSLGGTIFYGKTEETCHLPATWYEGNCWACFE